MPFLTSALVAGGLAAAGGIGSAAIGSHAAGRAANAQESAAQQAAQLQQEQLDFEKQQYATQQAQIAPWITAGTRALQDYQNLPAFQAPSDVTEQNDPGYQFRLEQGQQALERSAAAKGTLLSGGTAKALEQYGQGYASNEYGNVYNRALQQYGIKANQLSTLAGLGQTSIGQSIQSGNAANQATGNTTSNIGQDWVNAASARGSGYINSANAWGGALGNLSNLGYLGLANPTFGGNPTYNQYSQYEGYS